MNYNKLFQWAIGIGLVLTILVGCSAPVTPAEPTTISSTSTSLSPTPADTSISPTSTPLPSTPADTSIPSTPSPLPSAAGPDTVLPIEMDKPVTLVSGDLQVTVIGTGKLNEKTYESGGRTYTALGLALIIKPAGSDDWTFGPCLDDLSLSEQHLAIVLSMGAGHGCLTMEDEAGEQLLFVASSERVEISSLSTSFGEVEWLENSIQRMSAQEETGLYVSFAVPVEAAQVILHLVAQLH